MKMYIQTDSSNIVRDIIEYPSEGYAEVDVTLPLPVGVNGGWFKWENNGFVEYPSLKPDQDLRQEFNELKQVVADLAALQLEVK